LTKVKEELVNVKGELVNVKGELVNVKVPGLIDEETKFILDMLSDNTRPMVDFILKAMNDISDRKLDTEGGRIAHMGALYAYTKYCSRLFKINNC
jgi:hypothetical protein